METTRIQKYFLVNNIDLLVTVFIYSISGDMISDVFYFDVLSSRLKMVQYIVFTTTGHCWMFLQVMCRPQFSKPYLESLPSSVGSGQ